MHKQHWGETLVGQKRRVYGFGHSRCFLGQSANNARGFPSELTLSTTQKHRMVVSSRNRLLIDYCVGGDHGVL